MEIQIEQILPNPEQPRKVFDETELENLKESILQNGVILPIAVEEAGKDRYILHDGERRLRAAKRAGLKTIPATILPALNGHGKEGRLVRALVANIQRSDLNPIEEGQSFAELVKIGFTRNDVALKLGISAARVEQRMRLLSLEKGIQDLIAAGKLSKDIRLVSAMLDVKDSQTRVRTAKTLAEKGVTLKGCIESFVRIAAIHPEETFEEDEIPSIRLATRRTGIVSRPLWDVFASVGKVPPWLLMEVAARDTCNKCALRDQASAKNCRGCALVEVLKQMICKVQG